MSKTVRQLLLEWKAAENAVAEARSRRYRPPDEVDSLGAAWGAESAAWDKYQAAKRKEQERQL